MADLKPYIILPIDTYFGGKGSAGTYQKIINQIPPHKYFVAGSAGNCAITRYKKPADTTVVIDPDPKVIEAWSNAVFSDSCSYKLISVCGSFFNFLPNTQLINQDELFIYIDFPYLFETRKSQKPIYKYETTKDDHVRLIEEIKHLKCKVAISHYPCDIYDNGLNTWRKITFQSTTRQGLATEALYMNYPIPEALHDARFYGDDFRHRELIKKRSENLKSKIAQLPPIEKSMLFSYLKEEYPQLAS